MDSEQKVKAADSKAFAWCGDGRWIIYSGKNVWEPLSFIWSSESAAWYSAAGHESVVSFWNAESYKHECPVCHAPIGRVCMAPETHSERINLAQERWMESQKSANQPPAVQEATEKYEVDISVPITREGIEKFRLHAIQNADKDVSTTGIFVAKLCDMALLSLPPATPAPEAEKLPPYPTKYIPLEKQTGDAWPFVMVGQEEYDKLREVASSALRTISILNTDLEMMKCDLNGHQEQVATLRQQLEEAREALREIARLRGYGIQKLHEAITKAEAALAATKEAKS